VQADRLSRGRSPRSKRGATCAALICNPIRTVVHDSHEFDGLVGTGAATLAGLVFVTASVDASVFNESKQAPRKAYLTSTVAHFSSVLFLCMVMPIPTQTWLSLSIALGSLGVAGVASSARQWIRISAHRISDRMSYVFIPSLDNLLIVTSAVTLFVRRH